jgi:Na+-transporting NADH:ubiquinone oxidoreductase subunit NqrE
MVREVLCLLYVIVFVILQCSLKHNLEQMLHKFINDLYIFLCIFTHINIYYHILTCDMYDFAYAIQMLKVSPYHSPCNNNAV